MLHHFNFNGYDSREFDCYITTKTVFNQPKRQIDFISIPGRNGDVIIDSGRYSNIQIKLGLRQFTKKITDDFSLDFGDNLKRLTDWLSQGQNYYTYSDSYDPEYYRQVCITSVNVNQRRKDVADITLEMNAKPLKYKISGDTAITISEARTSINPFVNRENMESRPYYKLYMASGHSNETVTLTVNGRAYNIDHVTGYVEIDCDLMNVYKSTTNKNKDYRPDQDGNFPLLQVGDNLISFSNNISYIEIKPRWCSV